MKNTTLKFLTPAIAGLALGLLPNHANAQNQYFTSALVNNGTYSWDAANWSVNNGTSSGPFASTWVAGYFARFYGGAGDSYTVTVNADEQNTGLYNHAASNLTIEDAGSGTGDLDVITAIQGFLSVAGSTTIIDCPITGTGGVAPESTGSIYLMSANTYQAGTALGDSGNTLTYFNNNNAFSTGGISLNRTGNFSTLGGIGGSALTIANNFTAVYAGGTGGYTGLNFVNAANTPVNYSGTWALGTGATATSLNLRSSGGSTAPTTLSGQISGTGTLYISSNLAGDSTAGTVVLSAVNPFTGVVNVTGSGGTYGGNTAATLQLGVANAIADASSVVLGGGNLNGDGLNHNNGGTLGLTASSSLYFGGGNMSFANSSALTWVNVLDLADWTGTGNGDDGSQLRIGTDATGLTSAQLADIEFDNNASTLGDATIDSNGYIIMAVPEPSTIALAAFGGLSLLFIKRRKA